MSTKEKNEPKIEIKHYKRSSNRSANKELITEKVEINSATFDFLRRMEIVRLNKECALVLDMRNKVEAECKPIVFRGKTMWMDDESYQLFNQGLDKNKGIFTIGTYEDIIDGDHTLKYSRTIKRQNELRDNLAKAEKAKNKTNDGAMTDDSVFKPNNLVDDAPVFATTSKFSIVPLGYYHKRLEDRVQRISEITFNFRGKDWPAKTRDISSGGLLIKTSPACKPEIGDVCKVNLDILLKDFGQDFPHLQYKVVRIENSHVENIIALATDSSLDSVTLKTLKQYIKKHLSSGRRALKVEMSDAVLTARSMLTERYYAQSTMALPFFLAGSAQGGVRMQTLCVNAYNRQILKQFETLPGRYHLAGLIAPERVERFYQLGLQEGRDAPLVAVFRSTPESKPIIAADFEFPMQEDWTRFVTEHHEEHQFMLLKVMMGSVKSPDKMRIVRQTDNLAEKSLDTAEKLILQGQELVAAGALIDVTEELCSQLPSGSGQPSQYTEPEQSAASPPEILPMGYVAKHRKEARITSAVKVEVITKSKSINAKTRDFSISGLSLVLPGQHPKLKVEQRLEIGFPDMKYRGNVLGMLKRKRPSGFYEVVGIDRGKNTLLRMRLLNQERNEKTRTVLQDFVSENSGELKEDLSEDVRAAKSSYYSSICTESTMSLPAFIFTEPKVEMYRLSVGMQQVPSPLASFFETSENVYDFSALSDSVYLSNIANKLKKQATYSTLIFMYKEQVPGQARFQIHSLVSDELTFGVERRNFIERATEHDFCFVKLIFARPKQPPMHKLDQIYDDLKASSHARATELADEMKGLVAVCDIVDMTQQLSGVYNV